MMLKITDLFKSEPTPWGLRGDPYLWEAMARWFDGKAWPDSAEIFHADLKTAFSELTGHSIESEAHVLVEQFKHRGMSSGMVSPEFWRERGFPILLKSYRIANWRAEHETEKLAN